MKHSIRIHEEMMLKKQSYRFSQPTMNTAEPETWSQHLFKTARSLSDIPPGNNSLWTFAASTEVLYWLAKDIIQVLLESAGRKLGTRLVFVF